MFSFASSMGVAVFSAGCPSGSLRLSGVKIVFPRIPMLWSSSTLLAALRTVCFKVLFATLRTFSYWGKRKSRNRVLRRRLFLSIRKLSSLLVPSFYFRLPHAFRMSTQISSPREVCYPEGRDYMLIHRTTFLFLTDIAHDRRLRNQHGAVDPYPFKLTNFCSLTYGPPRRITAPLLEL